MIDSEDMEGFAAFESCLSDDGKQFILKIDSTVPMDWDEALLALAAWLHDEAKKLAGHDEQ